MAVGKIASRCLIKSKWTFCTCAVTVDTDAASVVQAEALSEGYLEASCSRFTAQFDELIAVAWFMTGQTLICTNVPDTETVRDVTSIHL